LEFYMGVSANGVAANTNLGALATGQAQAAQPLPGNTPTATETAAMNNPGYVAVQNAAKAAGVGVFVGTGVGTEVGTGDGTEIIHATSDVVAWRAIFPDAVELNV
jgi:hypothetical protein